MTMRGLIKIQPKGGGDILQWGIAGTKDVLAEYSPIVTSFLNWLQGDKRMQYDQSTDLADDQRYATYLTGGYSLYGEELELLYHGKETQSYTGIDTTQQPTFNVNSGDSQINYQGTNPEVIKTNEQAYREIKFKTTISIRDPDLPITGYTEWVRADWTQKLNPLYILQQGVQYGIDHLTGTEELKAYFRKRAEFLRDLDDIEVSVSSLMFNPLDGFIVSDRMTMQAGQTEAQFDIQVTELVSSIVATSSNSYNSVVAEPGLGFSK